MQVNRERLLDLLAGRLNELDLLRGRYEILEDKLNIIEERHQNELNDKNEELKRIVAKYEKENADNLQAKTEADMIIVELIDMLLINKVNAEQYKRIQEIIERKR